MPRLDIDNYGSGLMIDYIYECFRRLGKDLKTCEQCGITDKKLDIHHTKYDGATVYDLQLLCHKCNTQPANRYLC